MVYVGAYVYGWYIVCFLELIRLRVRYIKRR